MTVELRCETARGRRYARALIADARALLRAAGLARCELSLLLVDDDRIRGLNREFRHKDRATDVLSFPQDSDELLGDVVISIDTALRQARELDLATRERLRQLLAHGILHLLGYDHERSPAEARRQFACERELLAALGRMSRRRSRVANA